MLPHNQNPFDVPGRDIRHSNIADTDFCRVERFFSSVKCTVEQKKIHIHFINLHKINFLLNVHAAVYIGINCCS